ncbi:MAG: tetratricopeptide repeat protein, partial [Anaerolineae bacterium]|nr:tetratricopeptide repeat protein [Anaerolineae bacterium]
MTELSLQDYCDRIESVIEQGRYTEAAAHARQILKFYPKHVVTYRMLGTALLEADQDEGADDMFTRVLSSDPEDYLAWVGMSEVYERRGDLENAIWFLERAFDLAPDSRVLEEHLQDLRARRDGVREERVGLSRSALARLYIRGDLPSRAITELNALVEENPERVDLLLALAEAYWRDGQRVEASDLCQQVLNELPYCLKANLILADIWRETGRDEAGLYWRRAQALDPENRVAHELLGSSAGPVKEVLVPLLEYDAEGEAERLSWMGEVSLAGAPEGGAALVDAESVLQPKIEIPSWLETVGEDLDEREGISAAGLVEDLAGDAVDNEAWEAVGVDLMDAGDVEIPDRMAEGASVELELEESVPDEVPAWLSSLVRESSEMDELALP